MQCLDVRISRSSTLEWRRRFQAVQPIIGVGLSRVAYSEGIHFASPHVDGVQENFNDTTCPFLKTAQVKRLATKSMISMVVTSGDPGGYSTTFELNVAPQSQSFLAIGKNFTERPIVVCTEDPSVE